MTVTLTGVTLTGQQVSETTKTDSSGDYNFTNLLAGVYSLTDQPIPTQYTEGAATLGTYGGVVSNGGFALGSAAGRRRHVTTISVC